VPVCTNHKDRLLPDLRCVCGEYLLMQKGKFGIYFNCLRCGNMSFKKILEMNDITKPDVPLPKINAANDAIDPKQAPKNITIRSDDPDYFD
jgi:hypothetical protein